MKHVCVYPGALSSYECDYLRDCLINPAESDYKKLDVRDICHADICWVYNRRQMTKQIKDHLFEIGLHANLTNFKFDPRLHKEGLVINRYFKAGVSQRGWHYDGGYAEKSKINIKRKLTVLVQLSYPWEYRGSEIQFMNHHTPKEDLKQLGTVIVFPAYEPHQATMLKSGFRYSGVLFIFGKERFK